MTRRSDLHHYLDELVERHRLVGVGLAVLADGEVHELASGRADVRSPTPMTVDTLCLIGSTTKLLTATLALQLVDEGMLRLDDPVLRYLPGCRIPDGITVRQLLCHTSGLDVGAYSDHGRGERSVARYVATLGPDNVVAAPGEQWGYSNAGYVIAGRLVEVLRGTDWDEALRRYLLEPAGLIHSATLPEHTLLHPVSVPHVRAGTEAEVCRAWGVAGRALGPTGSTLAMTAGDLVRFAELHLGGGIAGTGNRLLSEESVAAMQAPQVDVTPGSPFAQQWALGWYAASWGDRVFRGHSGHNLGAGSHLALFPEMGGALALVFNTIPGDSALCHELFADLAGELFGATKPDPWLPVTPLSAPDLAPLTGRYACSQFRLDVAANGGALKVVAVGERELARPPTRMVPALFGRAWGSGQLGAHAAPPPDGFVTPELFFSAADATGHPRYAHLSVFPSRRICDESEIR
ncbi:MAG TPA: serine hydrolase domain-containing protein [Mycobacteriales bacterium]|nr:serine hydrolase domain-containing protein [Mycobacteriales bacterium]